MLCSNIIQWFGRFKVPEASLYTIVASPLFEVGRQGGHWLESSSLFFIVFCSVFVHQVLKHPPSDKALFYALLTIGSIVSAQDAACTEWDNQRWIQKERPKEREIAKKRENDRLAFIEVLYSTPFVFRLSFPFVFLSPGNCFRTSAQDNFVDVQWPRTAHQGGAGEHPSLQSRHQSSVRWHHCSVFTSILSGLLTITACSLGSDCEIHQEPSLRFELESRWFTVFSYTVLFLFFLFSARTAAFFFAFGCGHSFSQAQHTGWICSPLTPFLILHFFLPSCFVTGRIGLAFSASVPASSTACRYSRCSQEEKSGDCGRNGKDEENDDEVAARRKQAAERLRRRGNQQKQRTW